MMLESEAAYEALREEAMANGIPKEDPFKAIADKRARKILKQHKREIDRLKKHAEKCLYELNRDGYVYAIGKIRTIIRSPLSDFELNALYETSVERIIELAREAIEKK